MTQIGKNATLALGVKSASEEAMKYRCRKANSIGDLNDELRSEYPQLSEKPWGYNPLFALPVKNSRVSYIQVLCIICHKKIVSYNWDNPPTMRAKMAAWRHVRNHVIRRLD